MAVIDLRTVIDPATAGIADRYDNFIGGAWVPPSTGEYRGNPTPATGEVFTEVAYSGAADIEVALDAAHAAKDAWGAGVEHGARPCPASHRRRHRGQRRDARDRREL